MQLCLSMLEVQRSGIREGKVHKTSGRQETQKATTGFYRTCSCFAVA